MVSLLTLCHLFHELTPYLLFFIYQKNDLLQFKIWKLPQKMNTYHIVIMSLIRIKCQIIFAISLLLNNIDHIIEGCLLKLFVIEYFLSKEGVEYFCHLFTICCIKAEYKQCFIVQNNLLSWPIAFSTELWICKLL